MSVNERLSRELERRKAAYEVRPHPEAFSAQEVAHTTHVPGRLLAKPVVIREPSGGYHMVVVTAPQHVDLNAIHRFTGRPKGRLATEAELATLFPDCELGAMPPVGRLYGLETYIDEELSNEPDIYFQAGNHHEVVKMRFADYARMAGPFAGELRLHREMSRMDG